MTSASEDFTSDDLSGGFPGEEGEEQMDE